MCGGKSSFRYCTTRLTFSSRMAIRYVSVSETVTGAMDDAAPPPGPAAAAAGPGGGAASSIAPVTVSDTETYRIAIRDEKVKRVVQYLNDDLPPHIQPMLF